jgi:phosphohistidine swiveling domain-containing protein
VNKKATEERSGSVLPLEKLEGGDTLLAGAKAANLAQLMRSGFPVPAGFVVIGEASPERILVAARALGDVPLAVRSSAAAEDLADASFAGQYESFLDVRGDASLLDAVRRCRESTHTARVDHYRIARAGTADDRIAVLVQRMLDAEAAGVAFTANPVTGARGEVMITAARGLGERVVAGEAVGDEWVVDVAGARRRRLVEGAIDARRAGEIAELARRVEAHFNVPQDIEWAVADGQLSLLQARPMTALPEPAVWRPPSPGYWMRNFRLGEWLAEAMTPLFEDWLLDLIEDGYLEGMRRTVGARLPFRHTAINGWYYTATPRFAPLRLPGALLESRGSILRFVWAVLIRINSHPEQADRAVLRRLADQWRTELVPRYDRLVEEGMGRVDSASRDELVQLVGRVGSLAGEYLFSLAVVGGSAWKMEACLARFCRKHLSALLGEGVQVLLRGLPGTEPEVPEHAVQTVDWYRPTAGELGWAQPPGTWARRHEQLATERRLAEAACRAALADHPALQARFVTLLEVAQRYAGLREEQSRLFTLGWPLLRRSVTRLGELLRAAGAIDEAADVFFLKRGELARAGRMQDVVARRRARWERQRRLPAPLTIGKPLSLLTGSVDAVRTSTDHPDGAIVGHPASPGRASGLVRIVRSPEDFDRFLAGEVLVAMATAPAWTPLFARAAAVVTDGGSLAAHASLVAREYGIPAVVGTGDATLRLADGQLVTVDGGAGTVVPGA